MTRAITALAAAFLTATSVSAFAAAATSPAQAPKVQASLPAATHKVPTMSARRVEEIQAALQGTGEKLSVDGIWGPRTAAAMRDFQGKNELPQTARYDHATAQKLTIPNWS